MKVKLKRIVDDKSLALVLKGMHEIIEGPFSVHDQHGRLLFGQPLPAGVERFPVLQGANLIGVVHGGPQAALISELLSGLAVREAEKRALAAETLALYKEVNLLYSFSEKLSANIELESVARVVLAEARTLIRSSNASVMLLDADSETFRILSANGPKHEPATVLAPGRGIAGHVFDTGRAEIVNDAHSDPRFFLGNNPINSLMCAPIKTKEKVIGVINISSAAPTYYTAQDLKLFCTLTAHAASAIENAMLHERKLREERIKSNLERYVAAQVVNAIMEAGGVSLSSEKRHIAVLFSDIRNFTATCERLAAEEVVAYLNDYFTHMVDVIFCHDGTVNKFVGDMIFALFGAPAKLQAPESRALRAAITMQQCLHSIPDTWIRDNFFTGIGINAGPVVVGNVGSPKHMDYTAIGDEVNIASRLQSLAGGGEILVSRSVVEVVPSSEFQFKSRGSLKVKGRNKPVDVFEVLWN